MMEAAINHLGGRPGRASRKAFSAAIWALYSGVSTRMVSSRCRENPGGTQGTLGLGWPIRQHHRTPRQVRMHNARSPSTSSTKTTINTYTYEFVAIRGPGCSDSSNTRPWYPQLRSRYQKIQQKLWKQRSLVRTRYLAVSSWLLLNIHLLENSFAFDAYYPPISHNLKETESVGSLI